MITLPPETLSDLIDATWPAKSISKTEGWIIREGAGAGSRVSAATLEQPNERPDIRIAESAMVALGQTPIFMIRQGEDELDKLLGAAGYLIKDPVFVYHAPISLLMRERPTPGGFFEAWPPLEIQSEIWAAGGIDSTRLRVMDRVLGPKTCALGRAGDLPAGTAFAAIHDGIAMLHAIETTRSLRRQGVARRMIRGLSYWAERNGAHSIGLIVTRANTGANALYQSLGMKQVSSYHYRIKPTQTEAKT